MRLRSIAIDIIQMATANLNVHSREAIALEELNQIAVVYLPRCTSDRNIPQQCPHSDVDVQCATPLELRADDIHNDFSK